MTSMPKLKVDANHIAMVDSGSLQCFMERPRKTGLDKPLKRMNAFDQFTIFTASIIRSKKVFTR